MSAAIAGNPTALTWISSGPAYGSTSCPPRAPIVVGARQIRVRASNLTPLAKCAGERVWVLTTHVYSVRVYRDGEWFMVEVPELEGYRTPDGTINVSTVTQARHSGEIEQMARELIGAITDADIDDVEITIIEKAIRPFPREGRHDREAGLEPPTD